MIKVCLAVGIFFGVGFMETTTDDVGLLLGFVFTMVNVISLYTIVTSEQ